MHPNAGYKTESGRGKAVSGYQKDCKKIGKEHRTWSYVN